MNGNRIFRKDSALRCPKCGLGKARFECFYSILQYFTAVLECRCDGASGGIAARKTFFIRTDYEKVFFFDSSSAVRSEKPPKEVEAATELEKFEIYCESCFKHSHKTDWSIESDEPVVDEESVEYYAYCPGCGSEIEIRGACVEPRDRWFDFKLRNNSGVPAV